MNGSEAVDSDSDLDDDEKTKGDEEDEDRDQFYKTPFRPKIIWTNFHAQIFYQKVNLSMCYVHSSWIKIQKVI
jgi:hypothetical protein